MNIRIIHPLFKWNILLISHVLTMHMCHLLQVSANLMMLKVPYLFIVIMYLVNSKVLPC